VVSVIQIHREEFQVKKLAFIVPYKIPTRKAAGVFLFPKLWRCSRAGQNDGRTKKAGRAHEKGAQTGDNAIGRAQLGRTLASAIEDQELMFDEHRFGNQATGASRHCQDE
jgi:hypothetical protein